MQHFALRTSYKSSFFLFSVLKGLSTASATTSANSTKETLTAVLHNARPSALIKDEDPVPPLESQSVTTFLVSLWYLLLWKFDLEKLIASSNSSQENENNKNLNKTKYGSDKVYIWLLPSKIEGDLDWLFVNRYVNIIFQKKKKEEINIINLENYLTSCSLSYKISR